MTLLSRTSYPVKPPEHLQVNLTDIEEQICVLVDGCTKHLKNEQGIETTCRIAGGWVRDKVHTFHLLYEYLLKRYIDAATGRGKQ